jgi:hypothetical protein
MLLDYFKSKITASAQHDIQTVVTSVHNIRRNKNRIIKAHSRQGKGKKKLAQTARLSISF